MLESIAPGVWHAPFDLVIPPRVSLGGRMVVVRLPDGRLWLHSPGPIDDALAEELAALGEVGVLVAPNAFHHLYFGAAAQRYPDAERWVGPGLVATRPELGHDAVLGPQVPEAWAEALAMHRVGGIPKLDEAVFLHRPSKTLVVTDLVFNVQHVHGVMTHLVLWVAGTRRRLAVSRLVRSMIRDREAAAESAREILAWDFERVVMAHGQVLDHDAHARMSEALAVMRP